MFDKCQQYLCLFRACNAPTINTDTEVTDSLSGSTSTVVCWEWHHNSYTIFHAVRKYCSQLSLELFSPEAFFALARIEKVTVLDLIPLLGQVPFLYLPSTSENTGKTHLGVYERPCLPVAHVRVCNVTTWTTRTGPGPPAFFVKS